MADDRAASEQGEAFGLSYMIREIRNDLREVREAIPSLATRAEVAFVSARLDNFVPRHEMVQQAQHVEQLIDQRFKTVEASVVDIKAAIAQGPIAQWLVPVLAMVISAGAFVVSFFHPGGH